METQKINDAHYEFKVIIGRKLSYFSGRIISIYAEHGYKNIPFDREERQAMIRSCAPDILAFLEKVFLNKEMAVHLGDKFYDAAGNVTEFFTELDDKNMNLILTRNW